MDNKQIINRDFIGVIEEENGLLKYKKIEIPYPNIGISINNLRRNPHTCAYERTF